MNIWGNIFTSLKEALFPTKCLICGTFYDLEEHHDKNHCEGKFMDATVLMYSPNDIFQKLMNTFLCSACTAGFTNIESPICPVCGIVFESREGEDHVCGECILSPKRFRIARAVGVYDRTLMAVLHYFKYKGKIQLARPLGQLLFWAFTQNWNEKEIELIVPVPLHTKRLRKRGFNQAFLLIRNWALYAEMADIELDHLNIRKDILSRNRWTEPQTGLSRNRRMSNIKNAFNIEDSSKVIEKSVLLVDDVYTTGATADECTKTLLQSGAKHVDVLTLARAMR
ncbi:MAG: ComF family protein [Desulfobacterales bacterium]